MRSRFNKPHSPRAIAFINLILCGMLGFLLSIQPNKSAIALMGWQKSYRTVLEDDLSTNYLQVEKFLHLLHSESFIKLTKINQLF
jgi:hypothetical protein